MPEKAKIRVVEAFPTAFADFMGKVHEMIEQGLPETTIESDDLIQCEHTYGGLVDQSSDLYGFGGG